MKARADVLELEKERDIYIRGDASESESSMCLEIDSGWATPQVLQGAGALGERCRRLVPAGRQDGAWGEGRPEHDGDQFGVRTGKGRVRGGRVKVGQWGGRLPNMSRGR